MRAIESLMGAAVEQTFRAYCELMNPRVMGLAALSVIVGMLAAPGHSTSWIMRWVAIVFVALGAGASNGFNAWWNRRTHARPLPLDVVSPAYAIVWACVLALTSLLGLWRFSNNQAAWWMACAMSDYVVLYTVFSKPRSDQSMVSGGITGALLPLIGEAIVCGHTTAVSWLIGALIFFWTLSHFLLLSLFGWRDDMIDGLYAQSCSRGAQRTRRDILYCSLATTVVSLAPWLMGQCRFIYGFGAVWLGWVWMARAWQLYFNKRSPQSFLVFSVTHLVALLVLRVVDLFVLAYRW